MIYIMKLLFLSSLTDFNENLYFFKIEVITHSYE